MTQGLSEMGPFLTALPFGTGTAPRAPRPHYALVRSRHCTRPTSTTAMRRAPEVDTSSDFYLLGLYWDYLYYFRLHCVCHGA